MISTIDGERFVHCQSLWVCSISNFLFTDTGAAGIRKQDISEGLCIAAGNAAVIRFGIPEYQKMVN